MADFEFPALSPDEQARLDAAEAEQRAIIQERERQRRESDAFVDQRMVAAEAQENASTPLDAVAGYPAAPRVQMAVGDVEMLRTPSVRVGHPQMAVLGTDARSGQPTRPQFPGVQIGEITTGPGGKALPADPATDPSTDPATHATPTAPVARPRPRGGAGGRPPPSQSLLSQLMEQMQSGQGVQADLIRRMAESLRYEGALREQTGVSNAEDMVAENEALNAIRDEQMAAFTADVERQQQRLQEIDQQIQALRHERFDASRLFRDRGLGVTMATSVAVGAAQSFMANSLFPGTNTTNTALDIINGAIDRDLREQMVQRQDTITNIGMQRTALQMSRDMTNDQMQSFEYAKAKAQAWAAQQLRARAMNTSGQVARQQLERQALQLESDAQARLEAALMAQAQAMAPRTGGGAPRPVRARERDISGVQFAPMMEFAPGITPEDFVRLTETQRNRLWNMGNAGSRVMDTLEQMNAIMRSDGFRRLPFAEAKTRLEALHGRISGIIKEAEELGALDAGVERFVARIVPDPTTWSSFNESAIRAVFQDMYRDTERRIREATESASSGLLVFNRRRTRTDDVPEESLPPGFSGDADPEAPPSATGIERFGAQVASDPVGVTLRGALGPVLGDATGSALGVRR
jgi:hypothetical protein